MYAGSGIESYKAKPSYKANARLNKAQEKELGMKLCTIMAATTAATDLSPLTYLSLRQSKAGVVCGVSLHRRRTRCPGPVVMCAHRLVVV